jgi:hypothetical protein
MREGGRAMARVKQNSKANHARKVKQVPCEKTGSPTCSIDRTPDMVFKAEFAFA